MNYIDVEVKPPFIKLEQFLKFAGITDTGGQAKLLIEDGSVFVNNIVETARGKKIYDSDIIIVKGLSDTYRCIIFQ